MLTRSGGSRHITMPDFLETGPFVAEILWFFDFSKWRPPSSWIFKFVKFHWQTVSGRLRLIIVLNVVKNWSFWCGDITIFQIFKMAAGAILNFILAIWVQTVETHQHAKFCQNRSISSEDIKIFRFFKMAADAILDFQICEMLLAYSVWRAQTYHCTKFRQNWSFRCSDITIFLFLRWPPPPSWMFEIAKFYWLLGSRGSRRIFLPNFVKIGQSVAKILRFFDFSRWRPPPLSNSQSFIGCRCLEDPYASFYQISSKSVVPLQRYSAVSYTHLTLPTILRV